MTRIDRLQTLSHSTCCVCEHPLSIQELDEFQSATDPALHGEVHCKACMEELLAVCRECSGRYTADGICDECAAREYAIAV